MLSGIDSSHTLHSNRQGEVVLETSAFLAPLPELFRSLSPLQSVEAIPRQNRNAGKELATRGIYAVGIAMHDEGILQFDRFVGLSYDDMTTWVCSDYHLCVFASIFSSLPVSYAFILYVTVQSLSWTADIHCVCHRRYVIGREYFANIKTITRKSRFRI